MQVLQRPSESKQKLGDSRKLFWTVCVLSACMIPVIMAICFIKANGVNVPKADEWVFIHWYELLCRGKLDTVSLFFVENSEHKCVTAYWVMSLFTWLFSYNSLILMYAELACFGAICVILMLLTWKRSDLVRRQPVWLLPIPFFMLNFKQAESILWASCLIIGVVMLLIVTTFVLLEKSKKFDGWFGAAVLTSVFATFGHSLGCLLWPFGLAHLVSQVIFDGHSGDGKGRLARWGRSVVWLVCSVVVSAVYVLAPHGPHPKHESITFLKTDPVGTMQYFFACVANPCSSEITAGVAIGVTLCAVFAWVLHSALREDNITKRAVVFPVLLFALGMVSAVGVTYGRFAGVVEHALTSRYFALFAVPILGLYVACVILCREKQTGSAVRAGIVLAILMVATVSGDIIGIGEGYKYREQRMAMANMLKYHRLQNPQDITELALNFEQWIRGFESKRQMVFAEPEPPDLSKMRQIPVAGPLLVESINSEICHQYPLSRCVVIDTSKQKTLTVSGFALIYETKRPAEAVYVSIDGKIDFPATMGLARPAVARQYRRSAYLDSGFVACYDATKLAKGVHDVNLKVCCDRNTYFSYGPLVRIEVK